MINFLTQLPNRVLFSANNAVIRFRTNNFEPLKAEILTADFSAVIYPDLNGNFFFNFKSYLLTLANKNNYRDELLTNLPTTVNYAGVNFYMLSALVTIEGVQGETIASNINRTVIAGAQQLIDYQKDEVQAGQNFLLLPGKFAKYWEGYPFDLSYHSTVSNQEIKNLTNPTGELILPRLDNVPNIVNFQRVVFSDGRTDTNIDDLLAIAEGVNELEFNFDEENPITIEKIQNPCHGVYLKWFWNGAFLYWLFPKFYQQERTDSNIDEYETLPENLDDSFGSVTQFGKRSFDRISLNSDLLQPHEAKLLATLFDSPSVYMFTGVPSARAFANNWIEVRVDNGNRLIREWKDRPTSFEFSITLPPNDTLTK